MSDERGARPPGPWHIHEGIPYVDVEGIDNQLVARCPPAVAALLLRAEAVERAARAVLSKRHHADPCASRRDEPCDCGFVELRAALARVDAAQAEAGG